MSKLDKFRSDFPSLTFDALKEKYEQWYTTAPHQTRFSKTFFVNCFKYIVKILRRGNLKVLELGGYEGELALQILKIYPGIQWLNVEIVKHRMKKDLANYSYREHVLSDQLWNEKLNVRGYDVFASSHTLEHLSDMQVKLLFHYLVSNSIRYLILQLPIQAKGQTWQGYGGAHVLRMGSNQIKKLLTPSYCLVYERREPWYSCWRNRKWPK